MKICDIWFRHYWNTWFSSTLTRNIGIFHAIYFTLKTKNFFAHGFNKLFKLNYFFYFFAKLIYHKQYLPNQISCYLFYLSFLLILLGLLVVIYTVFIEPAARSWVDFFLTFFWNILFGTFLYFTLFKIFTINMDIFPLTISLVFAVTKLAIQTSLTIHFCRDAFWNNQNPLRIKFYFTLRGSELTK